jgi:hypothetical protein
MISQGMDRKYLVIDPRENDFRLVDELDRSEEIAHVLVEFIRYDTDGWCTYEKSDLHDLYQYCHTNGNPSTIDLLWGYPDVCQSFAFIHSILIGNTIPVTDSCIEIRPLTDSEGWNYISTQEDADGFMKLFVGFHDATLDRLVFEEKEHMTSAIAVFDNSGWYGIVEICFEKILAINIRPNNEYYSPEIYEATLIVKDEAVFWADDFLETEDLSYDGTYIKALSMKWRKIG